MKFYRISKFYGDPSETLIKLNYLMHVALPNVSNQKKEQLIDLLSISPLNEQHSANIKYNIDNLTRLQPTNYNISIEDAAAIAQMRPLLEHLVLHLEDNYLEDIQTNALRIDEEIKNYNEVDFIEYIDSIPPNDQLLFRFLTLKSPNLQSPSVHEKIQKTNISDEISKNSEEGFSKNIGARITKIFQFVSLTSNIIAAGENLMDSVDPCFSICRLVYQL